MSTTIDERLREVCAILNEGFATLETVNEARAALERVLEEADAAPAPHLWRAAREARDLLRTEGAELTPGGVARSLANAQTHLRHSLSAFCESTAVSGG